MNETRIRDMERRITNIEHIIRDAAMVAAHILVSLWFA
jgi:hypothetical protein